MEARDKTISAGVALTDEQAQEMQDYCEYYSIADLLWNLAHGITCPPNQPKIPISDRDVFRESLVEEFAERKRLARVEALREAADFMRGCEKHYQDHENAREYFLSAARYLDALSAQEPASPPEAETGEDNENGQFGVGA